MAIAITMITTTIDAGRPAEPPGPPGPPGPRRAQTSAPAVDGFQEKLAAAGALRMCAHADGIFAASLDSMVDAGFNSCPGWLPRRR